MIGVCPEAFAAIAVEQPVTRKEIPYDPVLGGFYPTQHDGYSKADPQCQTSWWG
jgi:hypothetical protein